MSKILTKRSPNNIKSPRYLVGDKVITMYPHDTHYGQCAIVEEIIDRKTIYPYKHGEDDLQRNGRYNFMISHSDVSYCIEYLRSPIKCPKYLRCQKT